MDIRLDGIQLINFKGIEEFTFQPNGKNATIRGDNATGKTSLVDAFRWLLFGKDSHDRADFQIKAVDNAGNEAHNLDHSVEAVLLVDGSPLRLKKVFKEKWTKKRGSSSKEFTGHTTDYAIDGVPVQKKEWDARIAGIIDEETFKLLTSPTYFNGLHWTKRREILLAVCGDVEDADVIASDMALASLPEILGGHSLDDHKKVLAARRKEINKRLEEIPARIDELTRSMADAPKDTKPIEAEIKSLQIEIKAAQDDTEVSALRKEKAEQEAKLAETRTARDKARREAVADLEATLSNHRTQARTLEADIKDGERLIRTMEAEADEIGPKLEALRVEYDETAAQGFEGATTCPTCGQALPEGQIEAAKAKHNAAKAEALASINRKGTGLKEEAKRLAADIEKAEKRLSGLKDDQAAQLKASGKLEAEIETAQAKPMKQDQEIEAIGEHIETLRQKIESRPNTDTTALESSLNAAQDRLAAHRTAEKGTVRVKALSDEEKTLAAEFERLERESALIDAFVVAKVNLLEDRIASRFEVVRFKMFAEQINGGISETCITTVNGVPYGSGLNNGAEINAGLDIIRTLSRHYAVTAPVWLDNAEAVTKPLPIEAQTIKLVVSPDHPKMEVEHHE